MRVLTIGLVYVLLAVPAAAQCFCAKCLLLQHKSFQAFGSAMAPAMDTGMCGVVAYSDSETIYAPGMVIAYRAHNNDKVVMVFRIIGVAGDRVQMIGGVPHINDVAVEQTPLDDYTLVEGDARFRPMCRDDVAAGEPCLADRFREVLPNGVAYEVLNLGDGQADETPVYEVPESHVFVMGDNRDNAADSRYRKPAGQGFVAFEQIIGVFEGL